MAEWLIVLNVVISVLSASAIVLRYRLRREAFFTDYKLYILFFSLFYISLPSEISLISDYSVVNASHQAIEYSSAVGLYFNLVFYISYLTSKSRVIINTSRTTSRGGGQGKVIGILALILFLFLLVEIILNISGIIRAFGNRASQSSMNELFEVNLKFRPIFYLQVLLVYYLFIVTGHSRHFLLLSPYVLLDLLLSGRLYLFQIVLMVFLLKQMSGSPMKLGKLVLGVALIASIGVLRSSGGFSGENIIQVFLEFIYTWSTTQLVAQSPLHQDVWTSFIYAAFRILPSPIYRGIFGDYGSYTLITTSANPLGWGLAGSVVAEAISFKNLLVLFMFPLLISVYGSVVNWVLRRKTLGSVALFVVSVLFVQQVFRYSFLEFALYPFYVVTFFGFWMFSSRLDLRGA